MLPGLIIQIGSDVRIEPRLAGAPRVIEAGAIERGPDRDDDALDGNELLDEPVPARVTVRPARRK